MASESNPINSAASAVGAGTGQDTAVTKKSIFDTGYICTSDAAQLPYDKAAFFYVGKDAFWELIVTRLVEDHREMYALHETIADAIVVHSTGAAPVQITIEGYLPVGDDLDMRTKFLKQYISTFRECNGVGNGGAQSLKVTIRHTTFNLHIQAISLIDGIETPDFTTVSIKGIASFYNQDMGAPLAYSDGLTGGLLGSMGSLGGKAGDAKNSPSKKDPEVSVKK